MGSAGPDLLTKYDGGPCSRCGGTLRWRANRVCVTCQREDNRALARAYKQRRRSNHIAYYGELLQNRRRAALKRMEARRGSV